MVEPGAEELFRQQRAIHARNRRRQAVGWGCATAAVVLVAAMFWWHFGAIRFALRSSIGRPVDEVIQKAGTPVRRWPAGAFDCARGYPCEREKARGEVLFFMRMGIGYYAWFDESGHLIGFDVNSS